eukprot:8330170-Pyramimonas_sp.AAC.1
MPKLSHHAHLPCEIENLPNAGYEACLLLMYNDITAERNKGELGGPSVPPSAASNSWGICCNLQVSSCHAHRYLLPV